jgi:nicotinate-nucleotide--dimethylbenzimidazole phosphoribosyltransferase
MPTELSGPRSPLPLHPDNASEHPGPESPAEDPRSASERRAEAARATVALLLSRLRTRQRATLAAAAVAVSATLGGTAWALLAAPAEPEDAGATVVAHATPDATPRGAPEAPNPQAGEALAAPDAVAPPTAPAASSLPEGPTASSMGTTGASGAVVPTDRPMTLPSTTANPAVSPASPSATASTHAVSTPAGSTPATAASTGSSPRPPPGVMARAGSPPGEAGAPTGLCDIQPGPEAGRQMRRCIEAYSRIDRAGL